MRRYIYAIVFTSILLSSSCRKDDSTINIFSVQDDIDLGQQLRDEILSNPSEYPVLSPSQYPGVYAYLEQIKSKILNSGQVYYKDKFEWELHVIADDSQMNAFCAPGGYIFIYTGILKYLQAEDQLAGVLGHEMAHADRRHSTDRLTQDYGIQVLLDVLLGENQGTIVQIANSLRTLAYSRNQEKEADEYSVKYLCPTDYEADGAADFFLRLQNEGNSCEGGAFFSTHPCPENRVQKIQAQRVELGCSGTQVYATQYQAMVAQLP